MSDSSKTQDFLWNSEQSLWLVYHFCAACSLTSCGGCCEKCMVSAKTGNLLHSDNRGIVEFRS